MIHTDAVTGIAIELGAREGVFVQGRMRPRDAKRIRSAVAVAGNVVAGFSGVIETRSTRGGETPLHVEGVEKNIHLTVAMDGGIDPVSIVNGVGVMNETRVTGRAFKVIGLQPALGVGIQRGVDRHSEVGERGHGFATEVNAVNGIEIQRGGVAQDAGFLGRVGSLHPVATEHEEA